YVAGVLDGSPWFDDLIFHDKRGEVGQGTWAVARRLRRERVGLAVLFPNTFRSALAAWPGGCPRRVGYFRHRPGWPLTPPPPPPPPVRAPRGGRPPAPALEAYSRLAELAGARPHRQMYLHTTPRGEAVADAVWRWTGLDRRPEVVCLNPGAAFGSAKYWPA